MKSLDVGSVMLGLVVGAVVGAIFWKPDCSVTALEPTVRKKGLQS